MESTRIKSLFLLIEYLHSNIANYREFDNAVTELKNHSAEISRLKNSDNFFDKAKVKQLQAEADRITAEIQTKVTNEILIKATELNLYDPKEPVSIWNSNIHEISDFEDDANINISKVIIYRDKFSEFKQQKIFDYFNQHDKFNLFAKILIRLFKNFSEPQKPAISKKRSNTPPARLKVKEFRDNIPERLKKIHSYLRNKELINCNDDVWLYWFSEKELNPAPEKIQWLGADTLLSNVIKTICNNAGKKYIQRAFLFHENYVKQKMKLYTTEIAEINGFMKYAINKI